MDLALAVRRLDLMMAQMHLELSERLGLSAAELLALAHLSLDGPLGPTDLTHRLHMTTGAMTALLDRLAERDYVVREPHRDRPPPYRRPADRPAAVTGSSRSVHGMADSVVGASKAGSTRVSGGPLSPTSRRSPASSAAPAEG